MKHFIRWNRRLSWRLYRDAFCAGDYDFEAKRAYCENPFAWLWMLVPIAGIVGLDSYATLRRQRNRRRSLAIREQRLRQRT